MKHQVNERSADLIVEWMRSRGGVAIWDSIDLSNPGSVTAPLLDEDGQTKGRPGWKYAETPSRVITDMNEIEIETCKEVKRFHVATRVGAQGFKIQVTDGGTRRIEREVEKVGKGAFYEFDYGDYNNAVILVPTKTVPLKEWL